MTAVNLTPYSDADDNVMSLVSPVESLHIETIQDVQRLTPDNNDPNAGVDGIEILINLSKTGKIDPWNVDIVQLTDEYLSALQEMTVMNLKLTGKTILLAAILLRMKSDKLSGVDYLTLPSDMIEDNDLLDWDNVEEVDFHATPLGNIRKMSIEALGSVFNKLDHMLGRRTSTKEPRVRRVTLDDLIKEVRHYEELERKRSLKEAVEKVDRRRLSRRYDNLSTDDIVDLAHDEFIEDTVLKLKGVLTAFFVDKEAIEFKTLTKDCGLDNVSAFVALLFLASRGEVDLEQEAFYTDLYVSANLGDKDTVKEADIDAMEATA